MNDDVEFILLPRCRISQRQLFQTSIGRVRGQNCPRCGLPVWCAAPRDEFNPTEWECEVYDDDVRIWHKNASGKWRESGIADMRYHGVSLRLAMGAPSPVECKCKNT